MIEPKYIALRGGEYELFRGYYGRIRPTWRVKFRGDAIDENNGFASSERMARAMVARHKLARG